MLLEPWESEWKDYYRILRVHPEAEPEVVQSAYRRLSLLYHPDKNPSPDATQQIAQINAAYEIVGNASRRAAYDRAWAAREASQKPREERSESARYNEWKPETGSGRDSRSEPAVGAVVHIAWDGKKGMNLATYDIWINGQKAAKVQTSGSGERVVLAPGDHSFKVSWGVFHSNIVSLRLKSGQNVKLGFHLGGFLDSSVRLEQIR